MTTPSWLMGPLALAGLTMAGCATSAPLAAVDAGAPASRDPTMCPAGGSGGLVVYSAAYAQTLEQSEYPAHTNYTVATTSDYVIQRVANNTGSFGASPATIELPCGHYHIRAQYGAGRFFVVPVSIQPGKVTTVDLTKEPLLPGIDASRKPIRLPTGQIVGWLATTG